ncbi:MAG: PIN/TRAM domain-containing protein [Planctomycetes bacterium]|nr:PIN/TRAM domain-containing protein [Planctomycetota bacterium]
MDPTDATPPPDRTGDQAAPGRRNRLAEADARAQRILMTVLRAIFVVVLISVVVLTVASNRTAALDFGFSTVAGLLVSAVALGLLVVTVDALTPNKRLAWVVGIFVGTMLGLVAAVALGSVIDLVAGAWDLKESAATYLGLAKVTLGIILVYLSISVVLTTRDDFRLVIPYVEFARQVRGTRPLLVDTSALVDGRIEELGRTGIIDAPVIVAQFVIDELQALADSGDPSKRARGRRGLEVLQRLRTNPWIDLEVEELRADGRGVDRALVEVAKADRFRIVTTDSALERVAEINGVACMNLNAVAGALRSGQSAGEEFTLEIVRPGENPHQGVGFLEDGTMVVVDHGSSLVGSSAHVVVTNTVQTSAGRLVFARVARDADAPEHEAQADAEAPDEPEAGDAASDPDPAADARRAAMARAATTQPRTPPRPGHDPGGRRGSRNPRR